MLSFDTPVVQGSANRRLRPGLVNFVPAVAYHFCLNLPEKLSQPGNGILAQPCTRIIGLCDFFASGHLFGFSVHSIYIFSRFTADQNSYGIKKDELSLDDLSSELSHLAD